MQAVDCTSTFGPEQAHFIEINYTDPLHADEIVVYSAANAARMPVLVIR